MSKLIWFVGCLLFLAGGCKPKTNIQPDGVLLIHSYDGRGIVRQIATDRRTVTIQHEAFPGYMAAMTMDFAVRDTNELNGLAPDDGVTFQLMVNGDYDWVQNLRRTGQTAPPAPAPARAAVAELKPGDLMPDAELVTESGARLHLSDFRGQAVAFTFFFTSCPLPDFCPRMNKNFAEARQLMLTSPGAPTNWLLLSISFDPGFDTPEVLSSYAGLYRGADTNHWLFASAPTNTIATIAAPLDLMIVRTGTSISHNLRTVVLDPQGRISRQLDGNEWTPQDLADALSAAARR
jgi:protein SCO1/2